jgi:hypothetical protein
MVHAPAGLRGIVGSLKGHVSSGPTVGSKGFQSRQTLDTKLFGGRFQSRLSHHPDRCQQHNGHQAQYHTLKRSDFQANNLPCLGESQLLFATCRGSPRCLLFLPLAATPDTRPLLGINGF